MIQQILIAGRARVLAILILSVIGISACTGGAPQAPPASTTAAQAPASSTVTSKLLPLTVANFTGTLVNILDELAQRQGFFQKNGLDVQFVSSTTATAIFAGVASGGIDIGPMGLGPILQAMEKDPSVQYRVVIGHTGDRTNTLLANSTVPATADTDPFPQKLQVLKGKKIGVAALGTPAAIEVGVWIKLAGMSSDDVTFVGVGGPATAQAALENNDVQAIVIGDPLSTTLPLAGKGFHNLVDTRPGTEGIPSLLKAAATPMGALRSWAAAHPKEVAAYQRSIAQADVWMHSPENSQALAGIESTILGGGVAEPAMSSIAKLTAPNHNAAVDPSSIGAVMDFYLQNGLLKGKVDTTGLLDPNLPMTPADVAKLATGS